MVNHFPTFDNINFNGGNISSDGGSILILNFLDKVGLKDKLNGLPFNDNRRAPKYSNIDILYQLISLNLLGYFNQSDVKLLKDDPLLSRYFDSCSQSSVSRFYDRVTNKTNVTLKNVLTQMACDQVNKTVKDPIIDIDSTLVETYGNQQASAYIHHYSETGYHPLVINEFNSKLLLSSLLRTGSSYSSNGTIEELMTVLPYLNNNGNIRFRADSAFYDSELLSYLEENKITYYVRAKNFKALTRTIIEDMASKDEDWSSYSSSTPYYGEISYAIGTKNSKPRRIVYKAYCIEEDGQLSLLPVTYSVVTNDISSSCYEAMKFYELRGAAENFNKELKNDFDGGRLSHDEFYQNEMEFLISSLSYNLYHIFQNSILENDDRKITMNTFRISFQKIACKVVIHSRRIILSFSSAYRNTAVFIRYWTKLLMT